MTKEKFVAELLDSISRWKQVSHLSWIFRPQVTFFIGMFLLLIAYTVFCSSSVEVFEPILWLYIGLFGHVLFCAYQLRVEIASEHGIPVDGNFFAAYFRKGFFLDLDKVQVKEVLEKYNAENYDNWNLQAIIDIMQHLKDLSDECPKKIKVVPFLTLAVSISILIVASLSLFVQVGWLDLISNKAVCILVFFLYGLLWYSAFITINGVRELQHHRLSGYRYLLRILDDIVFEQSYMKN